MKQIDAIVGKSRQAMSKRKHSERDMRVKEEKVVQLATSERSVHSLIGMRKIFEKHKAEMPMGRDRSLEVMRESGFRVIKRVNFTRTTYSIKENYYPNRIKGLKINDINQVWQSDITYIQFGGNTYYLVLIIDVYSRTIVGYSLADHMRASMVAQALNKAIRLRGGKKLEGLILHSDRGGQYISTIIKGICKSEGILQSMCEYAWENAYVERLNGILKQEYLFDLANTTLKALRRKIAATVELYNESRPHWGHKARYTPVAFEKHIFNLPKEARKVLNLSNE